jgi:hypothetical protein
MSLRHQRVALAQSVHPRVHKARGVQAGAKALLNEQERIRRDLPQSPRALDVVRRLEGHTKLISDPDDGRAAGAVGELGPYGAGSDLAKGRA